MNAEREALYEAAPNVKGPNQLQGNILVGEVVSPLRNHFPHRIWIEFLDKWYSSTKCRSTDEVELIQGCLLKSLADPHKLTMATDSFGTRIALLHLSLR